MLPIGVYINSVSKQVVNRKDLYRRVNLLDERYVYQLLVSAGSTRK